MVKLMDGTKRRREKLPSIPFPVRFGQKYVKMSFYRIRHFGRKCDPLWPLARGERDCPYPPSGQGWCGPHATKLDHFSHSNNQSVSHLSKTSYPLLPPPRGGRGSPGHSDQKGTKSMDSGKQILAEKFSIDFGGSFAKTSFLIFMFLSSICFAWQVQQIGDKEFFFVGHFSSRGFAARLKSPDAGKGTV